MSEITQRFEEINLIKAKVNTKFAVFNSDSGYEFHSNNGHEMKIQEDIKDFENEASPVELVSDENAKDGLQNCEIYSINQVYCTYTTTLIYTFTR